MIQDPKGEVTITNDGATILEQMKVIHPAAKMLVELSKSQDIEAGDGTTSVVVLCGSLLEKAQQLLNQGLHPSTLAHSWKRAANKSVEFLESFAEPINLKNNESLIKACITSLN